MTSSPKTQTQTSPTGSVCFQGRRWLLREVQNSLTQDLPTNGGVVIYGNPGTGKTGLLRAMSSSSSSSAPIHYREFSNRVIATHFADVSDESACLVANFVHSVAKQILESRSVGPPFRKYLNSEPDLSKLLTLESCCFDPARCFVEGVLKPLAQLRNQGKLFDQRHYLILVDGLCAGEMHRSDKSPTLSTFLLEHVGRLPKWIKLICTVRTNMKDVAFKLPFSRIW
jgi:hypothetical protein